jgi:hypothetical protein
MMCRLLTWFIYKQRPRSEPLRLRAMGLYLELVKRKVSSKRKLMAKHLACR